MIRFSVAVTLFFFLCVAATTMHAAVIAKRGFAPANRFASDEYPLLNAGWYYNWGLHPTPFVFDLPFTPMYWNAFCLEANVSSPKYVKDCCPQRNGDVPALCGKVPNGSTHVLGFNEPDLRFQSNMTVAQALDAWPLLVENARITGAQIGSPAMAGDPVNGPWMQQFMGSVGDTVNFTTLHWYKNGNATLFIDDLKALIAAYQKPVWVTEFNLQWGEAPYNYTQEEVIAFLQSVMTYMENEPMVHRYYFFDVGVGPCSLFHPDGTLTATGEFYSSFLVPSNDSNDSYRTTRIVFGVFVGLFAVGSAVFIYCDCKRRRDALKASGGYRSLA